MIRYRSLNRLSANQRLLHIDWSTAVVTPSALSQSPFGKSTIVTRNHRDSSSPQGHCSLNRLSANQRLLLDRRREVQSHVERRLNRLSANQRLLPLTAEAWAKEYNCSLNRLSANQRLLLDGMGYVWTRITRSQSPFGKSTIVTVSYFHIDNQDESYTGISPPFEKATEPLESLARFSQSQRVLFRISKYPLRISS